MDRRYAVGGLVVLLLAVIALALFLDTEDGSEESASGTATQLEARAQVESMLKNAATAEESYLTTHSEYTTDVRALYEEGLTLIEYIPLTIEVSGSRSYCIRAVHARLPGDDPWKVATYSSDVGRPTSRDDC